MNSLSAVLLVVALGCALVDWLAVHRQDKRSEYMFKPLTAVAFLVAAMALEPSSEAARIWMVLALIFCVAGDVFLMLPRDAFIAGLGSFAVAQILFLVAFCAQNPSGSRLIIGLAVVVSGASLLAWRFIGSLRRSDSRSLIPAVVVYIGVISAMVVSAIGGGTAFGIAGAVLFLVSDSLIAEQRFVKPRPWQPLAIIITYHVALGGLVLGLI